MNFKQAAALYKLELLPSEYMHSVAMSELESGSDLESVVMLAIEEDKTLGNLKPLFENCIEELGLADLDDNETQINAASYYAEQAKNGEIDEVTFGFKIGAIGDKLKLNELLWEAFQNAMWYEEAPYEYGYPADTKGFRKDCSDKIRKVIEELAA